MSLIVLLFFNAVEMQNTVSFKIIWIWDNPDLFMHICVHFTDIISDFSRIWTRVVGVEDMHADHSTATEYVPMTWLFLAGEGIFKWQGNCFSWNISIEIA